MRKATAGVLGFLVAPVVPALTLALASSFMAKPTADLLSILGFTALYYFVSAAATILFGIPAFIVLFRFKLIRWWSAAIVGAAIGILMDFAAQIPRQAGPLDLLIMGAIGSAAALAFWLIWRRTNKDNSS